MTRLAPPIQKQKPKLGTPAILGKIQDIQSHKLETPTFKGSSSNFNSGEKVGICPHGAMVWENRGLCKYGCTLKGSSTKGKKGKKEVKEEE